MEKYVQDHVRFINKNKSTVFVDKVNNYISGKKIGACDVAVTVRFSIILELVEKIAFPLRIGFILLSLK